MDSKVLRDLCEAYSEIYDEMDELSINLYETISYSFILSGFNSSQVIEYFCVESIDRIVEDYFNILDENFIIENLVSDYFIYEQLQVLDELAPLAQAASRVLPTAIRNAPRIMNAAKGAFKGGSGLVGSARAAGKALSRARSQGTTLTSRLKGAASSVGNAARKAKDYVIKNAYSKIPGGPDGKVAKVGKFATKQAAGGAVMGAGFEGGSRLIKGNQQTSKSGNPKVDTSPKPKTSKSQSGSGSGSPTSKPQSGSGSGTSTPRTGTSKPAPVPPTQAKTAPTPSSSGPAIGKLGNTTFERRTPTSAELKAAQAARASGANPEQALQAAKSAEQTKKDFTRTDIKMPSYMKNSFSWDSTSKLVDDIADAYSSVYEAKKVDQDKDGDNDFADVQIARMIASGVPKEVAIAKVKNKSYNEEAELDEATRMRKELGKEGEIATRKELANRSKSYKRSDSVDKTIAAAERAADRTTARNRDESDSDYKARMQKRSQTLRKLAANRRKSVRGEGGLRGYAAKVEGSNKDLQSARGSARSAGTLTNKERKQFGEEFETWIEALINEGYDLSDYTWDEMYEIYEEYSLDEETEEERKRNERRARIAELQAQGRVMTSAKRTSARAKERREEQKQEKLERLANAALEATRGATRRSSKPMGSTQPEAKSDAPAANRKLKGTVKNDKLASRADELLRMLRNEDFQLWVQELLDEGYTLENWTDEELVSLYEEIIEEKYGTAAGRKRVAKKARSGEDIGKKGPGFQKMVDKLSDKYGKERATKIAAAQMWKTHA